MAVATAHSRAARRVMAILGAKALTGGETFEALNHAGSLAADLLIVLEDPEPPSCGAMSSDFARVLSGWVYTHLREGGRRALAPMPSVCELARRSEKHLKGMVLPGSLFEELGVNYIGPMDGQDVRALVATLRNMKRLRGPQLLHIVTRQAKDCAALARIPACVRFPRRPPPWRCRTCDRGEVPPVLATARSSGGGCAIWGRQMRASSASRR